MSERSCSYSGGGGGAGVRAAAVASSIEARRLATSSLLATSARRAATSSLVAHRAGREQQHGRSRRQDRGKLAHHPSPPSGFPPSLEAAARRGGNGRRSGPGTSGAPKRRAARPPEPDSTLVYSDQGAPTVDPAEGSAAHDCSCSEHGQRDTGRFPGTQLPLGFPEGMLDRDHGADAGQNAVIPSVRRAEGTRIGAIGASLIPSGGSIVNTRPAVIYSTNNASCRGECNA